jgi:CheY-like chemotaxis protein
MKINIRLPKKIQSLEEVLSNTSLVQNKTPKILIVDENNWNRKSITLALNGMGYQTYEAELASEGLKLLAQDSLDLVLIALLTPDLTLLEFTEAAQQIAPNTSILFLSNSTSTWMTGIRNRNLIPIVSSSDLDDLIQRIENQIKQDRVRKTRTIRQKIFDMID